MINKTLKIKTYGKLNLFLDITGKRNDGYHLLQTVMQSVSVFDTLTFSFSDGEGIELKCDTKSFPLDERNLVWKAAEAFYKYIDVKPPYKITAEVKKNIPSMAGMAGGSADCAAALIALNQLSGAKLSLAELCSIGVMLGADVPFTLMGGTALCEGIGELLTILPPVPKMYFAVVKPQVNISTPKAYSIYDSSVHTKNKKFSDFEAAVSTSDLNGIAENIYNALEVAADCDEIKTAKEKMIKLGALNAMMTGSGSAVFGIFNKRSEAENCIKQMSGYSFSEVLLPIQKGWEIIK